MTTAQTDNWLIFIDTNIFLDFYRIGGDIAHKQLTSLEKHKDNIILNEQIRMEFLKNRQKVIIESINKIDKPKPPSYPPMIREYREAKTLVAYIKEAQKKYGSVKAKIENILSDPGSHDEIYKSLNRIFESSSKYNLSRPNKTRFEIRNLARKRFILGYPPRKQNDTSIGDSLNWEWIIKCAQICPEKKDIIVVSRDGDYGSTYGDKVILNDWLSREFKERVSRKRKIELTNKLTYALKLLSEKISPEEEKAENEIITQTKTSQSGKEFDEFLRNIFAEAFGKKPIIEMPPPDDTGQ